MRMQLSIDILNIIINDIKCQGKDFGLNDYIEKMENEKYKHRSIEILLKDAGIPVDENVSDYIYSEIGFVEIQNYYWS